MTPWATRKDLIILTADKDAKLALQALLSRSQSLNIRDVTFDVYSHPDKDAGCRLRGHVFLRTFHQEYHHALLVFDHEGCGKEGETRQALESASETQLRQSGWDDRAAAIVIEPELETWVWTDSPHVADALGWREDAASLAPWLRESCGPLDESGKPARPKEAMQQALRKSGKPWSSAIHKQIAEHATLRSCVDPTFAKLKAILGDWFPL